MVRPPSTSETVNGRRYCARGLCTECPWFFAATAANCSTVLPQRAMCWRANEA
jgi:hypothetical protein